MNINSSDYPDMFIKTLEKLLKLMKKEFGINIIN